VSTDQALELLKSAGMSGYEAKAYVALLTAPEPLNGYEVAKASGVPRSTVYETLSKLVARGAAFEVMRAGNGTAYVALPSEALVGRLRRDLSSTIDGLAEVLPSLGATRDAHLVQHVHGLDGVLDRAVDVVDGARHDVFVSVWPDEVERLRPSLHDAMARDVTVSMITFGELDEPVGHSFVHRFSEPDVVLERLGCRIFTVVADRDAVLIGGIDGADAWGLWSDDPAVVLVAAEYVRHDIAMQLVGQRLHEAGLGEFWRSDPELERLRATAVVAESLRDHRHR
jgi:HTH-type transcriptional regulator, sugar sensing transcriptional regulator